MRFRILPSAAELRERFDYDPETGVLRWRIGPKAGKVAGSFNKANGYLQVFVKINGKREIPPVHRVIWKLVYDEDPEYIDHIDGRRDNNALSNLRSATRADNARNARMRRDNTSGICGVDQRGRRNKWRARIHFNGKSHSLGEFDTRLEAIAARKRAEREFGFTSTHGQANRPSYSRSTL